MRNFLMGLIAALIAIALPLGIMPTATAAPASAPVQAVHKSSGDKSDIAMRATAEGDVFTKDCKSSVVDTPEAVTVKGCTYSETKVSAAVKSHIRAKVNGSDQVSWMNPTKVSGKITPKSVKRAPMIKVTMKTTSKSLWRKSHGAKVVRIVGTWKNIGMLGHVVAGFPTHSSYPGAVMVWNGKSHKYEHGASLWLDTAANRAKATADELYIYGTVTFGGKSYIIVDSCDNDLAGTYNIWIPGPVVQVKSEDKVLEDVTMEGSSFGIVELSGTKSCPAGDISWKMALGTSTNGVVHVLLAQHVVAARSGEGWAKASADAIAEARGNSSAISIGELTVTCSDNPPPTYQAPTVSGAAKACVKVGEQTGVITASGTNPNNVAASGSLTIGGQTKSFTSVGAGQSVTWDFSGFAPGTYNGSFSLGSPINKSATFTVTVQQCAPPVDTPPSVNGQVPEHVIYNDDALWADFDATDAEGHPITFEYSYDGPINIQAIQEVNTSTGRRLSIKFSAKYVAPGTTQDAHFYVTAVANGKRSSQFVGTVQVANLG